MKCPFRVKSSPYFRKNISALYLKVAVVGVVDVTGITMSAFDAVDGFSAGIATSANGTRRT